MKAGMRMMAINNARRNRERMEGGERIEYGRMGDYEMREREHYDNGRYAPQGNIGRERGGEQRYSRGRDPQRGMAEHHMMQAFDMEIAREWVESMHNEDGSTGAHWTMEQVKPIMQQKGVDAAPEEFWAIMNALYSDYCKVAKKHNVSTVDFYADMAKAWLDDKDAVDNKAAAYYEYVVKHE